MRILYLASGRIPTEKASGLAIARQCEAFADLGHQVTLLRSFRKNYIQESIYSYYNVKPNFQTIRVLSVDLVWFLPPIGFAITRCIQMFSFLLYIIFKRKQFDIVYTRDEWMLYLPLLLNINIFSVWEVHTKHNNFVVRKVLKKAKRILVISQGLRDFYSSLNQRVDILVEPSGVDLSQFDSLPSKQNLRSTLGLPLEKIIIGYVGKYTTMGESKGVDELIIAFARVYEKNPRSHLLIVGLEKHEESMVKALCSKEGLSESSYSLLPLVQKDFAFYLEASDILVMNYPDTEHYRLYMSPTKLFAYMASGKVIVASDLPSIREIVDDRKVVFVKPGDNANLAKRLIEVVQNLDTFQALSQNNKEYVLRYSWNSRSERIMHAL